VDARGLVLGVGLLAGDQIEPGRELHRFALVRTLQKRAQNLDIEGQPRDGFHGLRLRLAQIGQTLLGIGDLLVDGGHLGTLLGRRTTIEESFRSPLRRLATTNRRLQALDGIAVFLAVIVDTSDLRFQLRQLRLQFCHHFQTGAAVPLALATVVFVRRHRSCPCQVEVSFRSSSGSFPRRMNSSTKAKGSQEKGFDFFF
jgi:hypothetical protein